MAVIGWVAGVSLIGLISAYDHWVAFILLAIVGGKMIGEGVREGKDEAHIKVIRIVPVIVLSVATSIDALAVGLSFAVLNQPVLFPGIIIGITCALFSAAGVFIGKKTGALVGKKAEAIGGVMLLIIGIKILWEHLV